MLSGSRVLLCAAAIALIAFGCSAPGASEDVEVQTSKVVTSGRPVTPFGSPNSAETAMAIALFNGTYNKVIAFNYDDPAHITYPTSTTRTVTAGASGVGWNYSIGADTTDAFTSTPHRLVPPTGWPVLWSDPGIGTDGGAHVYLTALAIPSNKMPVGNSFSGDNTYIGGACIARSSDGGQNFSVSAADCVHDTGYSFYDGSDITGTTPTGPVVAAFNNTVLKTIDVWVASSTTGTFTQAANPFPGKTIIAHPRLRSLGNAVLLIAPDTSGNLWLQVYSSGAWASAANGFPKLAGTSYNDATALTLGTQTLRRGAQYDLVNSPSTVSAGGVIVFYSRFNSGHGTLSGTYCSNSATTCTLNEWSVDPGVNVFHPALGSVQQGNPGGAGTFNVLTWMQQTSGANVALYSNNLTSLGALTGRSESGTTQICPDTRGYWGDYDTHMAVWPRSYPSKPMFWRSFADSTDNSGATSCTRQWKYNSLNVNVSATWVIY